MSAIKITIARADGMVTKLKGASGMAVCMGPMTVPIERSDPPVVSLRCASEDELAWNLAALMGAVRHVSPHALAMARELMEICDFGRPQLMNRLPPEARG